MSTRIRIPAGTRDYLPDELTAYYFLERRFRDTFTRWGYREVRTPTFEFLEALTTGIGSELSDRMFKFQDQDGKIVALRAELTTPIARLVATKLVDAPEPIRLSYLANVFRYSAGPLEGPREFRQAGVENVGSPGPEADAEVIALLIEALSSVGLKDVRIFVNHSQLLPKLLKGRLQGEKASRVKELIGARDARRLDALLAELNVGEEVRRSLVDLLKCTTPQDARDMEPVLEQVGCGREIGNLLQVMAELKHYGLEDRIFLDFSLTRLLDYYTGVMFEAAVTDLGKPLAGGGRYDALVEKFGGAAMPATGFAIELDKCLEALEVRGKYPRDGGPRFLVVAKERRISVRVLASIRKSGFPAVPLCGEVSYEKAMEYARLQGCTHLVFFEARGKASLVDVIRGRRLRSNLASLLSNLRSRPT